MQAINVQVSSLQGKNCLHSAAVSDEGFSKQVLQMQGFQAMMHLLLV